MKRLGASFVVACRDTGHKDSVAREVVTTCICAYREAMARYGKMRTLEVWYESLEPLGLLKGVKDPAIHKRISTGSRRRWERAPPRRSSRSSPSTRESFPSSRTSSPPSSTPKGTAPGEVQKIVRDAMAVYRATLSSAYQSLFDRYELRDAAIKVVGIGSVGTSCWVLLFTAGEGNPLFLQVKEARPSVLEAYAGKSTFANHGQRVVNGYRLMQPSSDMFLGWSRGPKRDFFVRQLRDVKISVRVETFDVPLMELYASWCGKALALSHAQSGASAMLAGYMGKSDVFDEAIADFSMAYADQNEKDHAALERAVRKGTVNAVFEEDR